MEASGESGAGWDEAAAAGAAEEDALQLSEADALDMSGNAVAQSLRKLSCEWAVGVGLGARPEFFAEEDWGPVVREGANAGKRRSTKTGDSICARYRNTERKKNETNGCQLTVLERERAQL